MVGQQAAWGWPRCSGHPLTIPSSAHPRASPRSPPGTPAHLPKAHPSHTLKGPHLPELLPTEGMPAFFQGDCPSVCPTPPYLISVTPIPICFPAHSHTHPLSWLSKLSASLSSPAGGGVGGGAGWGGGGWPLRGLGKGDMGGGGPGCSSEKGKEGKRGERERQRQRQAASQPALYPCRIDLPCHSPGR